MLNKLKKKEEFEKVYKEGKTSSYGNIILRFVKNNLEYSRVGFVVSGKFSKKAVERNKIKRQLRNILQNRRISLKDGLDIVVLPKKEKVTFRVLQENIEKALIKAKITN